MGATPVEKNSDWTYSKPLDDTQLISVSETTHEILQHTGDTFVQYRVAHALYDETDN